MKKLLLALVMCAMTMSFAQTAPVQTKHDAFVSVGGGWTPNKDLTYSVDRAAVYETVGQWFEPTLAFIINN